MSSATLKQNQINELRKPEWKKERKLGIVLDLWELDLVDFIENENASCCFSKQVIIEFCSSFNQYEGMRILVKEFALQKVCCPKHCKYLVGGLGEFV